MFALSFKLLPIFLVLLAILILKALIKRAIRNRPTTESFKFKLAPYNPNQIATPLETEKLPYLKKSYLLTRAEKEFYNTLSKVIRNDFLLFSKVRMADLFLLPSMNNSKYYHYFGKIKSKHVDFLLCSKERVEPLLAIELDDSSHSSEDRIARDVFVDKLFEESHLPILHVRVASNYNEIELLNQIQSCLKLNQQAPTSSSVE